MTPLALVLLALAAQPGDTAPLTDSLPSAPATVPPPPPAAAPAQSGGTTLNTLPEPPGPSTAPQTGGMPPASPFGFTGPFPFAPNPWLAQGYSRPAWYEAATIRRPLESDHDFDDFIAPVSNPVLAKDPRAGTWGRFLFVNNNIPGRHPLGGGNAQFYLPQGSIALSERFSLTLDKVGGAHLDPALGPAASGALNTTVGAKWTFHRDTDHQSLAAAGLMVETPTGGGDVFQGGGPLVTPYLAWGLTLGEYWHLTGTNGLQAATNTDKNATFLYQSLHLDRQVMGCFYPLVEINWFEYVGDGDRYPSGFGEGDGLANVGSAGQRRKQYLSLAAGAKLLLWECVEVGAVYEVPLSSRKGITNNRVTVDMLVRY